MQSNGATVRSLRIPLGGMEEVPVEEKKNRVAAAGMGVGILSAVAASVCCIGPILAAAVGLTSLGALAKYEALRPLFVFLSVAALVVAFYFAYRTPRSAGECTPGSLCETRGPLRVAAVNRAVLWLAALITLVVVTFPTWSNWVLG